MIDSARANSYSTAAAPGRAQAPDRAHALDSAHSLSTGVSVAERESFVWQILRKLPDPEIPVLSILDLGIVRYVRFASDERLHVGITPTYSGCPATEVIRRSVREALDEVGLTDAVLDEVLSPPWTSDWLSEEGRQKLKAFGIAPPTEAVSSPKHLLGMPAVICPRCGSAATERISEFGSTPCKAHYRCTSCLEPFDSFKCI